MVFLDHKNNCEKIKKIFLKKLRKKNEKKIFQIFKKAINIMCSNPHCDI